MLALGRLYHESEMAAIQSCGVGPAGLFRPIGLLGFVVAALLVWLSFWAIPQAAARAQQIRAEALRDAQFGALEPGRFRTFAGGNIVFYAERVDDNRILHNVNVFVDRTEETGSEGKMEVWVATRARAARRGTGRSDLRSLRRRALRGCAGERRVPHHPVRRGRHPDPPRRAERRASKAELKPTRELLRSADPADTAELQWRISTPILALVLMVLAVPLARLRPRQGRFGRIGVAILAYFLYSQLLAAARTWVESSVVPRARRLLVGARHRVVPRACGCWCVRVRRASRARWRCRHERPFSARYVMRAVLGHTLLVMLVLLALSGLYLFITQQDDIGIGTYTLEDAFLFVGLNLPQYAFDMLPIAALIGALLALGNLARSMELIVVRAAGVSVVRIALWVAGAGVILMMVTGVLGELVAPQMEQYARRMKTFEKFHDYSLAGNRSAWAKDGDTIVSVGQQSGDNRYGGVYVFNFDAQHRLRSVGRATNASIDVEQRWRLENYRESRIEEERVVAHGPATTQMRTRLSPEFLGLAVLDPESLPGARPAQLHPAPEAERPGFARLRDGVLGAHRPHGGGRHHRRARGAVRVRADALDRHRRAHGRGHHDRCRVLPAREDAGERRRGVRAAADRDRLATDRVAGVGHQCRRQSCAMTSTECCGVSVRCCMTRCSSRRCCSS